MTAAARAGWRETGAGVSITMEGVRIWHGAGRRALAEAAAACDTHDLVILSEPGAAAEPAIDGIAPDLVPPVLMAAQAAPGSAPCTLIDADLLKETGALAIDVDDGAITIRTARRMQGDRLWTR